MSVIAIEYSLHYLRGLMLVKKLVFCILVTRFDS